MNYYDIFQQHQSNPMCVFCQTDLSYSIDNFMADMAIGKCNRCSNLCQVNTSFRYIKIGSGWYLDYVYLNNLEWDYIRGTEAHHFINNKTQRYYFLSDSITISPDDFQRIDKILLLI